VPERRRSFTQIEDIHAAPALSGEMIGSQGLTVALTAALLIPEGALPFYNANLNIFFSDICAVRY
jgi:hypothetical protein